MHKSHASYNKTLFLSTQKSLRYSKGHTMYHKEEKKKPSALVILDGFGYSAHTEYNAIAQAHHPFLDYCFKEYPHALLHAAGTFVGLRPHVAGNSEVGHLTIGTGTVIEQPDTIISKAIADGSFFTNPILHAHLEKLARANKNLHLMGLLSDASVHSNIQHLYALLKVAAHYNINNVYIHAFLDGRDVAPKSAQHYLQELDTVCKKLAIGALASLTGRLYAMDRNSVWQRTKQVYDMLTVPHNPTFSSWQAALNFFYTQGITDEFIPPTPLLRSGFIQPGDGIICFNFRPDRSRQLAAAFVQQHFMGFIRHQIPLSFFITLTDYHTALVPTTVLFEQPPIKNTLKDFLLAQNKSFFAIAETEKFAHVTYFFSGGKQEPYSNETRVLIPSLIVQEYSQYPEMCAQKITDAVILSLQTQPQDFYLINYANADMVGHSGNLPATIKAIECLDHQLKQLYHYLVEQYDGTLYITADHGKAEDMFDTQSQQPRTAHTNNLVPFIMINKELKKSEQKLPLSQLSDIAPFIKKNILEQES